MLPHSLLHRLQKQYVPQNDGSHLLCYFISQPRRQSVVGDTVQDVVYRPHRHCLPSKQKKKSALCGYHVRPPARQCDVVSAAKPPVRLS